MDLKSAPALPLAEDQDFDISHELAILYRIAELPQASPRRHMSPAWPSVAAIALALGWGGSAYAARATYTVAPGETLYQIASRHLGSGTRWVEIAALNDIKDPARVQAGQAILLPDRRSRPAGRASALGAVGSTAGVARTRAAEASSATGRMARTGRQVARNVRIARAVGRTHDGIPIVPAGDVVLELPARKVEVRPAVRSGLSRPVAAERVRPQQDAEIVAPLPAPPAKEPVSPWRAVDGAAFLLGALGMTGLLTRTGSRRRNPQAQWQSAAQAIVRESALIPQPHPAGVAAFEGQASDFWGPLQTTDLGRLAVGVSAR